MPDNLTMKKYWLGLLLGFILPLRFYHAIILHCCHLLIMHNEFRRELILHWLMSLTAFMKKIAKKSSLSKFLFVKITFWSLSNA